MKRGFSVVVFLLVLAGVSAQNVDEVELKRPDLSSIQFRNYVGPTTVVNTAQEIRTIGTGLGAGVQNRESFTLAGKYTVIRVYNPEEPKLSADILVLEPSARVDHINGLNLIISAYLERVFGYSRTDSQLIANFVTRYNALYRGNLGFYQQTFVTHVATNLTAANAGLSTYYAEWPGRSRIVIPLRTSISAGPRGQVDADEISRPEVTQNLPDSPESLQQQREIVNLREREITKEETVIQERERELNQRETPPETTVTTVSRPENPRTTTTDPTKPETENTSNTNQPPATNTTTETTTTERQQLEQAKEEVAQREAALQRDREQITQQEQNQETQQPAAQTERVATEPVLFLSVEGDGTFSRLMVLDALGKKSMVRSELNSIRGRRFENLSDGYLVIAGREGGDAAVRLLVLDKTKLETLRQGTNDIHPDSDLVVQGQTIFAAVKDGVDYKLAIFNAALVLQKKSIDSIVPQTAIQIDGSRILVQGADGKVLFLNATTLERSFEVAP